MGNANGSQSKEIINDKIITSSETVVVNNDSRNAKSSESVGVNYNAEPVKSGQVNTGLQHIGYVVPDKNKNCLMWAKNNECTKNPNYMLKDCQSSCNKTKIYYQKINFYNKRIELLNDKKELKLRTRILGYLLNQLGDERFARNINHELSKIIFMIENYMKKTLTDPYLINTVLPNVKKDFNNELKMLILHYNDDKLSQDVLIKNKHKIEILDNILNSFNTTYPNDLDFKIKIIDLRDNILPRLVDQINILKVMLQDNSLSNIKLDIANLLQLYSDERLLKMQIRLLHSDINELKKELSKLK